MSFDWLTTLTLIWLISTFILIEADKQLSELLSRLKAALSMDEDGAVLKDQLIGLGRFSFPEMLEYKEAIGDENHINVKMIDKAINKQESVKRWKLFLVLNLFLLTTEIIVIMNWGTQNILTEFVETHILASLFFSAGFYLFSVNKIQDITFMKAKK